MKYLVIIILSVLSFKIAVAQNKYVIEASTPQSLNNEKVFLIIFDVYSSNKFLIKDSTIIKNGNFRFSGSIRKPTENARIYILNKKRALRDDLSCCIDSGVNNITINAVSNSDPYPNNRFSKASILNSPSNLIYKKIDSIYIANYKLYGAPDELPPHVITIPQKHEKKLVDPILNTISSYPNDFCSLIELYKISNSRAMQDSLDCLMKYYLKLSPKIRATSLGKEFNEVLSTKISAQKATKSGERMPLFSIKNDKGVIFKNIALSGKPYIIAFSATWCIPCQLYQKKLLNLYHKYQSKGLEVVYFNLDDNVAKWEKHISEKKLDWINVSERTKFKDSKIAKQFNVTAIPLYLIVNKQGKIIYNADEMKDDDYTKLESYIIKAIEE